MQEYFMTRAGYDKIKAELDNLEGVVLPDIERRVAEARAEGDLRENAEYHGARESQGMTMAKINLLRDKLNRARIVDASTAVKDEISFGSTVRVRDLDLDEEESLTLVGSGEENYDEGKILVTSPLAQGLLGHKVGDKVEIQVPAGVIRFEVLEISLEG